MSTDVSLAFGPNSNASVTGQQNGKSVPAFLLKLFNMVNDHGTDALIRWNESGDSFLVLKHEQFAKELLPRYYKHNNFSSFVRQLNMYGFHKIPHIEDTTLPKTESSIWEFSNPNFQRDQPDLLCLVTRKKSGEGGDRESLDFQTIMNEIHAIKRHQMTISQDLKRIQLDSQALWQEQIDTRSRHTKHQETIEKILSFLSTVYGGVQRQGDKIRQPKKRKLMIEPDQNRIFEDDRAQETFEDMFKSASTSPDLRPLPRPASSSRSAQPPPSMEQRFTMPNFDMRSGTASQTAVPQQLRNMNKKVTGTTKRSQARGDRTVTSTLPKPFVPNSVSPIESQALQKYVAPSSGLPIAGIPGLEDLNAGALFDSAGVGLEPAPLRDVSERISQNTARAQSLESDLALQDQNIEALTSLLGLQPYELDGMAQGDQSLFNFDPNLDFDTGQLNADYGSYAPGDLISDAAVNYAYGAAGEAPQSDVRPEQGGTNQTVNDNGRERGARITSLNSTPSADSPQEVDKADAVTGKGKKRKSVS